MSRGRRLAAWLVLMLASGAVHAAEQPLLPVDSSLRTIAIQHRGRVKPLDSFARETLRSMTGADRVGRQDPLETVLSIVAEPDRWQTVPLIQVPFRPLREALGMDSKTPRISYQDLVASRKLMRLLPAIMDKEQRNEKLSMFDQEALDVYQRFVALSGLLEGDLHLVPTASPAEPVWGTVGQPGDYPEAIQADLQKTWTQLLDELRDVRSGQRGRIERAAAALASRLRSVNLSVYPSVWRLQTEVSYNRHAPFRSARLLYFLAALALMAGLATGRRTVTHLGQYLFGVALLFHGNGILLRVTLGGRPPVSNFYETMLWLPLVGVVIALLTEWRLRVRYLSMAAAVLAGIMLTLAEVVPLDSSIAPVVAVLRSNFWLTIHVLTIVASYGALALAAVLAHIYSTLFLRRRDHAALPSLDTALYRVLQVGVVLLAAGIMLGAVWANASWGRYWGWDPKETWALITLLWFLALLHGRLTGWLQGVGMALATVGGFLLLLMTYYGVSFYLVGLHSYAGGHAKPLPVALVAYLAAELAFLAWVACAAFLRKRA